MDILKTVLIAFVMGQGVFAAVTITDPTNGNGNADSTIAEDNAAATTIHTVVAETDSSTVNSYTVVDVDGSTTTADFPFEFAAAVLKTKATATFDYETKRVYIVKFDVVDDVPSTATGTLTVAITDVDEYTPSFSKASTCGAIAESSSVEFEVGSYFATDMDGTADNRVTSYVITGGDDSGTEKFQISNSGVITRTAVALDKATKSEYKLVVEARGPGKTGTTTITVYVDGACADNGAATFTAIATATTTLVAFLIYHIF